jgi:3D (Asp-Asp-Asp) domain-containing protein
VDQFETASKDGVSEITVRRGMTVTVYSGGEVMQIVSYGETVQQMVERMGIPLVEESVVSVPMDTMTYDGMEILIQTTLTTTDSYTAVIPYETVYQETGLLKKGQEVVLTAGVDGQKLCTAEVTYIDGEESSRELLTEEVVTEPVTQVVAIGTGKGSRSKKPIIGDGVIITGSGDVLTYTRRDTFKATAYCRTDEGGEYTSTGTRTRVGAIAVDPRVIPYGTRMFIMTKDGSYIYGVATAEDCGGAIKGKRLDLFYETNSECIEFGRRNCDVYFLG